MRYTHVVLGGTFDHLHAGHLSPLKTAFTIGEHVTIGLTNKKLFQNKAYVSAIQPYRKRKEELMRVIRARWPKRKVSVVPISDIFGPSVTDPKFEAMVATKASMRNAILVNREREKNGLKKLEIVTAPEVEAQDNGEMSSSRVRAGEIDRYGFCYRDLFPQTLHLPSKLRTKLRIPLGTIIRGSETDLSQAARKARYLYTKLKKPLCLAVGDVVSASLEEAGLRPDMKIIDFKTQRKSVSKLDANIQYDFKNFPGTINAEATSYIFDMLKSVLDGEKSREVRVDGEEDLLVLPTVLFAPLGSVILYGQKDLGIVMVTVTEEVKTKMRKLIAKFS